MQSPTNAAGAITVPGRYFHGTRIDLTCKDGSVPESDDTVRICGYDGQWQDTNGLNRDAPGCQPSKFVDMFLFDFTILFMLISCCTFYILKTMLYK